MEEELYFFKLAFRHYIGRKNSYNWQKFKRGYIKYRNFPKRCDLCSIKLIKDSPKSGKISPRNITNDHIIPEQVLVELELYELWFDYDNHMILCYKCNQEKGGEIPHILPKSLQSKLQTALDRRNSEYINDRFSV